MLTDLRTCEAGHVFHADICIVGGGAAGITLARQLIAAHNELGTALGGTGNQPSAPAQPRILILESGGIDFDRWTQSLAAGANLGCDYYDLIDTRLRFLGGTTNIWGGRLALLDAVDFRTRDWVPHSGWPLDLDALLPYYRRAHASFDIGAFDYQTFAARGVPPPLDADGLATSYWQFDDERERFQHAQCVDLIQSAEVQIVTHATVTDLTPESGNASVASVTIDNAEHKQARVRARQYVLACGGIDNPRLLLWMAHRHGVGNGNDLVGRFFMEHPHGRVATVSGPAAFPIWDAFRKRFRRKGSPYAPVLRLNDAQQAGRRALNSAVTFKLQRPAERGVPLGRRAYQQIKHQLQPTKTNRRLWHGYRFAASAYARTVRPAVERWRTRRGHVTLSVVARAEQAPNPESRVRLGTECDALGVPLADLDWRLTTLDKTSMIALVDHLDATLAHSDLGTTERADWLNALDCCWPVDPTVGNHPIAGYHHIGTTRMHSDPRRGVVDTNLRVHGLANLYVLGSSVFPTSGWANPTLTILALAHRLADHLRGRS